MGGRGSGAVGVFHKRTRREQHYIAKKHTVVNIKISTSGTLSGDCHGASLPRNDMLKNGNKMFISAPHPSLRDIFSPRAKALTAVQLITNGLVD